MKIIYHCYGGTHSSVLSAAIHTNLLPPDRIPEQSEILNLPYYDKIRSQEIGIPLYFGQDEDNNLVYIQGMGRAEKIVINTLNSYLANEGISREQVYLQESLHNTNLLVRIGGFLSRGLGFVFPGRWLTVYGLQLAYPKFVAVVQKVKKELTIA